MTFKKILSGSLAAAMLAGTLAAGSIVTHAEEESKFTDLAEGGWYNEYVDFAYDIRVMNGVTETSFAPDEPLTRAMFATILGRYAREDENETAGEKFKDIEKNSWYSGYVGWAAEIGVVKGTTADTFEPDAPITRAEIATMLGRYIEYAKYQTEDKSGVPESFEDKELIDSIYKYAADYIETLREGGVMDGKPGEGGKTKFDPSANATRAEAAKLVKMLDNVKNNTPWEGYVPNPAEDGYAVYGASYLYWGGPVVQGGLGTDLDRTGKIPALTAYPDAYSATLTYAPSNTVGISSVVSGIDPREFKFIKICFAYEDGSDEILSGMYSVKNSERSNAVREAFVTVESSPENGYRTAIIDLSEVLAKAESIVNYTRDYPHILFTPNFEHGKLNIRYIAAFKSAEEAEAYTPSKAHEDYFMNYRRPATLNYERLTDEETERQDKLVREKIEEVMNAKSIITPESIKAAGYNCYYVSSEHGNDEADGRTPETAWKTIRHLTEVSNDPFNGKVEPGDGVFFERGSVFYPERPTIDGELRGLMTLYAFEGINYGAYGDESLPKPLFSGAMDFRGTPTGNGIWEATEYPNIWKLDQSDKDMEYRRNDVGNIIFNDGEFIGVHIRSELKSEEREKISPFGEGKEMEYLGYQSNGKEEFLAGGAKNPENISDVLKHNLEFFQDQYEGVLYLYWDGRENPGQNPADSFDSINVSRECHIALGQAATSFDNVAFKYSSAWLVSSSILGSQFTNCEFGFCGGGYLSVASGVEVSGERVSAYEYYLDNLEDYAAENKTHHLIENCYFHDIEDGPMSAQNCYSQNINQKDDPMLMKGIEYSNNVIVSCGNGAELFAGLPNLIDSDGYMIDKMQDLHIHDNIMAYIGYGITQQDDGDTTRGTSRGDILCGSVYGELVPETCIFEDNTLFKCISQIASQYVALDGQPRGWNLRNNTYILPENLATLKNGYENFLVMNHRSSKDDRITMPYNERYLRYFNSVGFDRDGKFYHYAEQGVNEDRYVFFLTGYHISRGIEPVITRVS